MNCFQEIQCTQKSSFSYMFYNLQRKNSQLSLYVQSRCLSLNTTTAVHVLLFLGKKGFEGPGYSSVAEHLPSMYEDWVQYPVSPNNKAFGGCHQQFQLLPCSQCQAQSPPNVQISFVHATSYKLTRDNSGPTANVHKELCPINFQLLYYFCSTEAKHVRPIFPSK